MATDISHVLSPELGTEQDSNEEHLLSAADLAKLLRISVRTLWRIDSAGHLPLPVLIGGRTKRWRPDEMRAWVIAGCPARTDWTWNP